MYDEFPYREFAQRMSLAPVTYVPIGVYRQVEHRQKSDVPRQGVLAAGEGTIALVRRTGIEHALGDLQLWPRIWIVFHFHEAGEFRPTVWPPRSQQKRGVLATRSPHRPNAIGLSAARLLHVDAEHLQLRVAEADLLDGTPVLDVKPYVAYADAFPDAGSGWLAPVDPLPAWDVQYAPNVLECLRWLDERATPLREPLLRALALGPTPQPYRRIRKRGDDLELSLKEWRATFRETAPRTLTVLALTSGYKPAQRETEPALALHREFETFRRTLSA